MNVQVLSRRRLKFVPLMFVFVMVVAGVLVSRSALWAATANPTCTVKLVGYGLNVRKSPGTGAPLTGQLRKGDIFQPVAIVDSTVDTQNPRWLQIKLKNGKRGWISANKEFVTCTIDLSTLPKKTNRVVMPAKATSAPLAYTDLSIESVGDAEIVGSLRAFGASVDDGNQIVFRDYMEIQVTASYSGKAKGQGIQGVYYLVADAQGKTVFERTERTYPYCLFSGNSGDCSKVWDFAKSGNKWPKTQMKIDPDMLYTITIDVNSNSHKTRSWTFQFRIAG